LSRLWYTLQARRCISLPSIKLSSFVIKHLRFGRLPKSVMLAPFSDNWNKNDIIYKSKWLDNGWSRIQKSNCSARCIIERHWQLNIFIIR
jgi:hypothetical protein